MPACAILLYREHSGVVPFDAWVRALFADGATGRRVVAKLRISVERLAQDGHSLRRPTAAPLRDGIYELRVSLGRVHYRVLYFFAGPGVAVLSHGCTKQRAVPLAEIDRAVRHRRAYLSNPARHTAAPP